MQANGSRIQQIFDFQVRSTVTFPGTDEVSTTFDALSSLKVPVRQLNEEDRAAGIREVALHQCLDMFFAQEGLDEENWVFSQRSSQPAQSAQRSGRQSGVDAPAATR